MIFILHNQLIVHEELVQGQSDDGNTDLVF